MRRSFCELQTAGRFITSAFYPLRAFGLRVVWPREQKMSYPRSCRTLQLR